MSGTGDTRKPPAGWRRAFSATRPRILAGAVLVLALSEVGSVVALRQIFQRFDRGTGHRGSSEGAGLGLSIVRAIAEAHGGTVNVRSRLGEGATFTIEVPSRNVDDQPKLG